MRDANRGSALRRLRHAAGAFLVVGLLAQLAPSSVVAGPQQTKEKLEQAKRRVEGLQDDLDAAKEHLAAVEAELAELTAEISRETNVAESLAAAIFETEQEIDSTDKRIGNLQTQLDARARAVYIMGPAAALDLILEADSLGDLSDRLTFLEALSNRDASLSAGLGVERRQLSFKKSDLRDLLEQQREVLAKLAERQAEMAAKQQEAAEAQRAFEDKLEEAKDLVDRLEDQYAEELAAVIRAAQRAAASPGGTIGPPVNADGPLYWCPVDPPRSYVDDFGAPRVGHTHQGNDIFAPTGTPIRAPFEGTAEEGYDGLGGIVVHVYASASADYVYNAHLSQHAGVDGQHVVPGQQIGYVGNTGNAQGTSPHDHFEYHPGGGSAVSPYLYLNEVCGVGGSG